MGQTPLLFDVMFKKFSGWEEPRLHHLLEEVVIIYGHLQPPQFGRQHFRICCHS